MATTSISFKIDKPVDDDQEEAFMVDMPMSAPAVLQIQCKTQEQLNGHGATVSPLGLRLEPIREGRPHSYTQAIQERDVVETYDGREERTTSSEVTTVSESPQDPGEVAFITKVYHIWSQAQFPEFDKTQVSWVWTVSVYGGLITTA